jgi:hypothetical protein
MNRLLFDAKAMPQARDRQARPTLRQSAIVALPVRCRSIRSDLIDPAEDSVPDRRRATYNIPTSETSSSSWNCRAASLKPHDQFSACTRIVGSMLSSVRRFSRPWRMACATADEREQFLHARPARF